MRRRGVASLLFFATWLVGTTSFQMPGSPRSRVTPRAAAVLPPSFDKGNVAVITGAAAGLGAAAAIKCAERGMKIVLCDVDEADLKATTEACRSVTQADDVLPQLCDVSDYEAVKAMAALTFEEFGGVHFLFNNAGTGIGSPSSFKDLDGCTCQGFLCPACRATFRAHSHLCLLAGQKNLGVNLFGILHVLQAFVPRMLAQGTHATIVNTGSKQGLTCPPGNLA